MVKKFDSKTTNYCDIVWKENNSTQAKVSRRNQMTKAELKKILQLYHKISREIREKKKEAIKEHYGRKYVIQIPEWAWKLEGFINEVIENEEDIYFTKIIIDSYVKGKNDKVILVENPISESTFYRWKRKFEEKLYELYIAEGLVSKEEIIDNKIVN